MKQAVAAGLIIILLIYAFAGPIPVAPGLGRGDFRAYWSAAYLLADSENFSDPDLLLTVEKEHTGWSQDYAVYTWNPPWLLAILLPYTQLPFDRATWLWLLTNVVLVFTGAVLTWQASAAEEPVIKRAWIAPLMAILFLPTLLALRMGQVNTLVFVGLAAFLYLDRRHKPLAAGASLVLTLVKPHLVYLTIPILALRSWWRHHWRLLWGLGMMVAGLTFIVFLLRPSFVADYGRTVGGGDLLAWETPTLGGILATTFGWESSKLMGIVILPLGLWFFWRRYDGVNTSTLVQITLLISVITAPFGWGYDAIVLLIPVLQIVVWIFEKRYSRVVSSSLVVALLLVNSLAFYQRTLIISEVQVFWIPIAIAIIYFLAWRQANQSWQG